LTSHNPNSEGRGHYDVTLIEVLVELELGLLSFLVELERESNLEVVVEGVLFIAEVSSELLALAHTSPLAAVRHQDDVFDNLIRHLLEGGQYEDLGSCEALIFRVILEVLSNL